MRRRLLFFIISSDLGGFDCQCVCVWVCECVSVCVLQHANMQLMQPQPIIDPLFSSVNTRRGGFFNNWQGPLLLIN